MQIPNDTRGWDSDNKDVKLLTAHFESEWVWVLSCCCVSLCVCLRVGMLVKRGGTRPEESLNWSDRTAVAGYWHGGQKLPARRHIRTHTHRHCHTSHTGETDASKMPNEINIASNAAWQCKCICKINRCIYLGEGFIIVSMPVCVRLCASSCCDAKNNACFVFAILFACARMAVCVCVSGALTPKKLTLLCICFTRLSALDLQRSQ